MTFNIIFIALHSSQNMYLKRSAWPMCNTLIAAGMIRQGFGISERKCLSGSHERRAGNSMQLEI